MLDNNNFNFLQCLYTATIFKVTTLHMTIAKTFLWSMWLYVRCDISWHESHVWALWFLAIGFKQTPQGFLTGPGLISMSPPDNRMEIKEKLWLLFILLTTYSLMWGSSILLEKSVWWLVESDIISRLKCKCAIVRTIMYKNRKHKKDF